MRFWLPTNIRSESDIVLSTRLFKGEWLLFQERQLYRFYFCLSSKQDVNSDRKDFSHRTHIKGKNLLQGEFFSQEWAPFEGIHLSVTNRK